MTAAERLQGWIDGLADAWKDRLRGWMASWLMRGLDEWMEEMEPEAIELVRSNLTQIRDHPDTPEDIRTVIDRLLAGTHPLPLALLIPLGVALLIPTVTGIIQPLGNLIRYDQDKKLHTARLDPLSTITAWRRDPAAYESWFQDLRDQGWTDERIEVLKYVTLFYPSPGDLVHWQAREVFEPEMVSRYGLDDELEGIEKEAFYKAGMTDEQIRNYWRAHWEHASWIQVVEMHRRGLLTEDELRDWFRLVEIPPFWRERLIGISWEVPTRVDVRRFWDMRTIDEPRLREIYLAQGYHDKDLDDYVLWTKIYVSLPDLMARYTNGWISLDQVRQELIGLGMAADRAEELIQTKVKAAAGARTTAERDLTKADITKGVKVGAITRAQGVELLEDLGYDREEALFILEINIPSDEEEAVVTHRQLTKSDVLSGLKQEIIKLPEARSRLLDLRYSPADVDVLLGIYAAQVAPPVELATREASKADIVQGVKKGLISSTEGYLMLVNLGFTGDASQFILMVRAEESPFSPVNFAEFKRMTQQYRRATGQESSPVSDELTAAAAEVVRLTGEAEALAEAVKAARRGLAKEAILPAAATAPVREAEDNLARAEAALAEARARYDVLLAQWRHAP